MKRFPLLPHLHDLSEERGNLLDGHLWLCELIDGAPLRFQLTESGLIVFGDAERTFDDPDDIPAVYGHAVRYVRTRFDRETYRRAVDDVTDATFFGVATHRHSIDYEWHRLPSFLGTDVWSRDASAFRPPDAASAIFDALGLRPITVFERERHARDFDPSTYDIPSSAWYDGPSAGVVIRNKRGGRAKIVADVIADIDAVADADGEGNDAAGSVGELAEIYATRHRFDRLVRELREVGRPVTADVLTKVVIDDALRECHHLVGTEHGGVSRSAWHSAIGARVRTYLDGSDGDDRT